MSKPIPTTNAAAKAKPSQPEKTGPECAVCKQRGAMWLLRVGNDAPVRVHRPCGNNVMEKAPEEIDVAVFPSRALRDEWNRKRQVNDFWSQKLSGFTPEKKA